MPTYDYRCPNGHDFERFFRKISDAASELPCPECGETAGRRLSGGAGLLFKGSGFYLTDYGRDAHRKPAPAAGGDKTDGAGADAKPSAKPDERAGARPATQPSEAKSPEAKSSEKPVGGDKSPKAKGGE